MGPRSTTQAVQDHLDCEVLGRHYRVRQCVRREDGDNGGYAGATYPGAPYHESRISLMGICTSYADARCGANYAIGGIRSGVDGP